MLIWLLLLLLASCLIGLVMSARKELKGDREHISNGLLCGIVVSIIALVCTVGIAGGVYLARVGAVANMDAFYTVSERNYAFAVNETTELLTLDEEQLTAALIDGSIEKFKLGDSAATRIVEYRDIVNAYNTALYEYRAYDNNFWLGAVYPTPPERLKAIVIGN